MWAAFLFWTVGVASAQSPGDFTILDDILIESSDDAESYMANGVGRVGTVSGRLYHSR